MILVRALLSGGSIAFPNSLKHEEITQTLKRINPTHVSFVSTTLARILKDDFVPSTNLKFVFLGGGPVSHKLCEQAINRGLPIIKVYGSTETCSMVTALLPDEVKQKPDSVGKVFGMNKIKIKSMSKNDFGDFCGSGEVGEIVVSSQSLFSEYYNNQVTTEKVLENGWYHTGDYGWLDKEGYLYISSRREDLIITGGENVNALDVQNVLKSHSFIEDAFVFALKDDVWGQIVCAAIVSKKISDLEIINFLKENIAGYKIPKRFFFIDSIPRNEMGKVKRTELLSKLNLS
jgi:O-succinylbenzoic acid--CoA ligase